VPRQSTQFSDLKKAEEEKEGGGRDAKMNTRRSNNEPIVVALKRTQSW